MLIASTALSAQGSEVAMRLAWIIFFFLVFKNSAQMTVCVLSQDNILSADGIAAWKHSVERRGKQVSVAGSMNWFRICSC